jgi:predicted RNase H-like HicB family nuclease
MNKYEIILYWSNDDDVYIAEVPNFSGVYRARCYAGRSALQRE